eukprot:SAG31_NODE_9725_length_1236_cov_2.959543_1_plen_203_part_01
MEPSTHEPPLRFGVGARVRCKVSATLWRAGRVVRLWYREENWPAQVVAPYQIELDVDSCLIYCPEDSDGLIQADFGDRAEQSAPPSCDSPSVTRLTDMNDDDRADPPSSHPPRDAGSVPQILSESHDREMMTESILELTQMDDDAKTHQDAMVAEMRELFGSMDMENMDPVKTFHQMEPSTHEPPLRFGVGARVRCKVSATLW